MKRANPTPKAGAFSQHSGLCDIARTVPRLRLVHIHRRGRSSCSHLYSDFALWPSPSDNFPARNSRRCRDGGRAIFFQAPRPYRSRSIQTLIFHLRRSASGRKCESHVPRTDGSKGCSGSSICASCADNSGMFFAPALSVLSGRVSALSPSASRACSSRTMTFCRTPIDWRGLLFPHRSHRGSASDRLWFFRSPAAGQIADWRGQTLSSAHQKEFPPKYTAKAQCLWS